MASCQNTSKTPAIDLANFDLSVAPNADFYQYATGGWQAKNPLKPEYSRYGAFDVIAENNETRINDLFQEMAKIEAAPGSVEQKISDLYKMGLDSVRLNAEGAAPVKAAVEEILAIGVEYLRIEGMCYCGIGILFLLYGLFRGLGRPGVSVVLTVVSLGTRVALAYLLAPIPAVGLKGIWWAVPIGWVLADLAGLVLYRRKPLPAETACAPEG